MFPTKLYYNYEISSIGNSYEIPPLEGSYNKLWDPSILEARG